MSLLNLAWHQPILIPLMGEALPLREREGGRLRERKRKGGEEEGKSEERGMSTHQ